MELGIASEIEEARKIWEKSPGIMRAAIVLTIFFTISSITSLADIVFQWMGFILTGIEFYRSWITEPLVNYAASHDVFYSSSDADYLVFFSMVTSSAVRLTSIRFKVENSAFLYGGAPFAATPVGCLLIHITLGIALPLVWLSGPEFFDYELRNASPWFLFGV